MPNLRPHRLRCRNIEIKLQMIRQMYSVYAGYITNNITCGSVVSRDNAGKKKRCKNEREQYCRDAQGAKVVSNAACSGSLKMAEGTVSKQR